MNVFLQICIDNLKKGQSEYRIVARSINSRDNILEELISLTSYLSETCSTSERLYNVVHNIQPAKCVCGNVVAFRSSSKGYGKTCGNKSCVNRAQQETIRTNTPIHHFSTENFKQKYKKTMIDKYGTTNYFSSDVGKQKIKSILLEKYGKANPAQIESVKQKIKTTIAKNTVLKYEKKLSVHHEKAIEYSNNHVKIFCYDCNSISDLSRSFFVIRNNENVKCCTKCNPIKYFSSNGEKELIAFISTLCESEMYTNNRTFGKELDIFIPSKKIAFEFNGTYWHSELYKSKNFHLEKSLMCKNNSINLYHVWQDDWEHKNDIVKSRIKAIFGKYDKIIYARKTTVKTLSTRESKIFFEKNHLQGNVNSEKVYALQFENEIVCAISIGKSRFKKNEYELLRYASLLNTRVVGGLEKLLSYYKLNNTKNLITYSDNSWGYTNFYSTKGFVHVHDTSPGYWYLVDNIRKNRFNFQKHKLEKTEDEKLLSSNDILLSRKIYKIYDCGTSKWILKANSSDWSN